MVNLTSKTSNMNISLLYGMEYRKIMSKQSFTDSGSVFTLFLRERNLKIIPLLLLPLWAVSRFVGDPRGLTVTLTNARGRGQMHGNQCWSHCSLSPNLPSATHPLWVLVSLRRGSLVYSGNWDSIINEHCLWADIMREQRTQSEMTEAKKPILLTANCKLSWKILCNYINFYGSFYRIQRLMIRYLYLRLKKYSFTLYLSKD